MSVAVFRMEHECRGFLSAVFIAVFIQLKAKDTKDLMMDKR
jgi:hypothetical protein